MAHNKEHKAQNGNGVVKAAIVGAVVGAAATYLSNRENREKVKQKAEEIKNNVDTKATEVKEVADEKRIEAMDKASKRLNEMKTKAKRERDKAKENLEEIV